MGWTPYDANVDWGSIDAHFTWEQVMNTGRRWQEDTVDEIAKLLTVDANGNSANSLAFDASKIVQFGFNLPQFTPSPDIELNAAVTQDNWTAGYFTFTTQPNTNITVDFFAQPLTAPDPLRIPVFAFLHYDDSGAIDRAFVNVDILGITNQLQLDPTTITLAANEPGAGASGDTGQQTSSDTTSQQNSQDTAATCSVRAINNANVRSHPSVSSERVETLAAGVEGTADGVTVADGYPWYRLLTGGWIRGDLVHPGEGCENLPTVSGS